MTHDLPTPRSPLPTPYDSPTPHSPPPSLPISSTHPLIHPLDPTLIDLSAAEQESLAGGFRRGGSDQLFFQHTEIDSVGEEQTLAVNGNSGLRIASFARSSYGFRQTTLSFLSSSLGRGGRNNPLLMMFSLFRNLFA